MKKVLLIVFLVVFTLFLVGCGDSDIDSASVKTWTVTRGTGLYQTASADAQQKDFLEVGTRVTDINGNDHLSSCVVTEGIETCFVEVIDAEVHNRYGWVIKKYLD